MGKAAREKRAGRRLPALAATIAVFAASVLSGPAAATGVAAGDGIIGTWLTGAKHARVDIARDGEEFTGRVVWLEHPLFRPVDKSGMEGKPKVDLRNPDPGLRDRPILGLQILNGFHFEAGEKWPWTGGTVYDPENGRTYEARLRLEDADTLRIRGFFLIPLFGRSTTWTRVSEDSGE